MGGDSKDAMTMKSLIETDSKGQTPNTGSTPTPSGQIGGITGYGTVQPFLPGMDQMIANQLAQGGYGNGNPQTLLSAFEPIFRQMQIPYYGTPGGKLPDGITPLPKGENTERKSQNEMLDAETGRPIGDAKGFRIEGSRLVKIPRR